MFSTVCLYFHGLPEGDRQFSGREAGSCQKEDNYCMQTRGNANE